MKSPGIKGKDPVYRNSRTIKTHNMKKNPLKAKVFISGEYRVNDYNLNDEQLAVNNNYISKYRKPNVNHEYDAASSKDVYNQDGNVDGSYQRNGNQGQGHEPSVMDPQNANYKRALTGKRSVGEQFLDCPEPNRLGNGPKFENRSPKGTFRKTNFHSQPAGQTHLPGNSNIQ
jgi:hypothetical protein